MRKEESNPNNNKKEEIKLSESINNNEKIKLDNEFLASIFKNSPCFNKKYENEELNKFKDDILLYLSERNQHYMSLIKLFKEKIDENKKEYNNKINSVTQNYNSILSSQATLNNSIEKISNFELFINKTNDQLITHEIRINNLSTDFIKSTQKYDKIYLDNLELPGYIGKFAKYKNCQVFFENVIREFEKINQYKEKNNIDIKAYKDKLDGIIKSFHLLVKNNNEAQMKYIKQLNDKCCKECKDMNDLLSNRVCDLRIENAKYSIDLVKKSEEMNKEWKKILEIKDNLINLVNDKMNKFKNIFNNNINSFNIFKKEFEELKMQLKELSIFYKESKIDNNLNEMFNTNSCNNYTGCYLNSALTLEKKNWKYFPRKFSKKSKNKNKYLNEKKQLLKTINSNKYNEINKIEENKEQKEDKEDNNKETIILDNNSLKVEENNKLVNKQKEIKKRNFGNSLKKEKAFNSIDKYKSILDGKIRKNVYGFKEPRSCKSVTKIEINSHDKINSIDKYKKEDNKLKLNQGKNKEDKKKGNMFNIIHINNDDEQKVLNNETSNNLSNSSSSYRNHEKENEKEKLFFNKFKENKKSILKSNKSTKSDDLDNISNINNANSNTLNSTNDNNYSMYSGNSICNINKFILNDGIIEGNDRVIKELASELEQSTNKKDKLASNKKKIEDNFKIICNKISPLNLNKNNEIKENKEIKESLLINDNESEKYQFENINNNLNICENLKINTNTISTEKTEEHRQGNNNICTININQNDYNLLNKKIDLFDKKLFDLESLLKEKIFEILLQMDNLQNIFYHSFNNNNNKKPINQKLSLNNTKNSNINTKNINIEKNGTNDNIANNIAPHNYHDDYFVNCHSFKKIAPIIEINPDNLQFLPSPSKTQTIIINKKSREQNKNKNITNNFKNIKIFRKNEGNRIINNLEQWDLAQYRLNVKNGSILGVNKWINLNKLIKYEQSKTANLSNIGGLLNNGNYDS